MKVQSMFTVLFTSLLAAAAAAAAAPTQTADWFTHHVDGNLHFPDNKDMHRPPLLQAGSGRHGPMSAVCKRQRGCAPRRR